MVIRKIVNINQEKCDGCGLCVPACAEGAIKIINGKAALAADNLCDGLGDCLGDCPQEAISIIEREADEFDAIKSNHGGCPGSKMMSFNTSPSTTSTSKEETQKSQLGQWPVQLKLVPVTASFFQNADLLITADCVPFAYADYHRDFLARRAVVIGCPKLDDLQHYIDKLTDLFNLSSIRSITVLRMEVPCCGGIVTAAHQALKASGQDIPFREVSISICGERIIG